MSRTREWMKFGSVVSVTAVLAFVFVSVLDVPGNSLAQESGLPALTAVQAAPVPQAVQPAADLGESFVAVSEAVRPAVVFITNTQFAASRSAQQHPNLPAPFDRFFQQPDQDPTPRTGTGSGFIVSADGYILTNNHVVEGADELEVGLFDGRKFDAQVVGRDPDTDIAVIKIDGADFPSVAFGDSDSLRVGEWVLAIGNPLGEAFSFTVTAGIVSGRGRPLRELQQSQWAIQDFIQTDAAINPGNSGGPLVNIHGQVVGINSAIASQTGFYAGYSFAIPANLARRVADQLVREGRVVRAALGISVADATAEDAEYVGLDGVYGVTVQGFSGANSPAERAGLQVGDLVVDIDGTRVRYVAQLQQVVGFKRPGDEVRVTVMREGGQRRTFTVQLIEAQTEERPQVAAAPGAKPEETVSFQDKLGVDLRELSASMATRLGLEAEDAGLLIQNVDQSGPARRLLVPASAQMGIFELVTHINGEAVHTLADVNRVLQRVSRGEVVSLRVLRVAQDAEPVTRVVRYRAGGQR